MLNTAKKVSTGVMVLNIIVAGLSAPTVRAQSKTADSFNFDELSAGGIDNWNFSSEAETISIQNNLQELREYDVSGRRKKRLNIRQIRENSWRFGAKGWVNRGDRPYYSLGNEFYPHYFWENRIYNYYR